MKRWGESLSKKWLEAEIMIIRSACFWLLPWKETPHTKASRGRGDVTRTFGPWNTRKGPSSKPLVPSPFGVSAFIVEKCLITVPCHTQFMHKRWVFPYKKGGGNVPSICYFIVCSEEVELLRIGPTRHCMVSERNTFTVMKWIALKFLDIYGPQRMNQTSTSSFFSSSIIGGSKF